MKKKILALLVFAAVMAMCVPFAVSADAEFVDTIEDGFPKADSWSDRMYYQYNPDMDCTVLVKQDDSGSPLTSEYIVYKMDADITGFSLDCLHVNGLGNGETDVKVYVSADKTDWTPVPVKASEQTFNEDIFINFDMAYWLMSTVSNQSSIPAGNRYIKIELTAFTKPDSCTWNTVIDTVRIATGSQATDPETTTTVTPEATTSTGTQGDDGPSGTTASDTVSTKSKEPGATTSRSGATDSAASGSTGISDESNSAAGWVIAAIAAVVVVAGAAVALVLIKKKKTSV